MELQTIDYDDKQIVKTMQETVARGTTPAEFALVCSILQSDGVKPLQERNLVHQSESRLANHDRHQWLSGLSLTQAKTLTALRWGLINAPGEWVKTVPDNSFIGAWCRVYRKDRRIPMEGEALLADYAKGFGLWKTAPRIMIKKVAESIALRKAFPQELNGLYTREEMPGEYSQPSSATLITGGGSESASQSRHRKKQQ